MMTIYNNVRKLSAALLLFFAATTNAEVDPLSVYVRTIYPQDTRTVIDAVEYILEPIGYQIVLDSPAPLDARELASKRIEPIAKLPRTMSIADAILVLIGTENYLIVDHKHKLVSFTKEP